MATCSVRSCFENARELLAADRTEGVEQGAQRNDLAHIGADAELQREGVAVGEPIKLDLRKLKLALAGRKRGRQGQHQANRASRETPPEIARRSPIRTRFGPERNSKSGHQKEPSGITGIGRTASVMHQFRENRPAKAECIVFEAAVKCIGPERRRPPEATHEPSGGSTSGILTAYGQWPWQDGMKRPPGRCAGLFQVTGVARPKRKGGRACQKRPRLKASSFS